VNATGSLAVSSVQVTRLPARTLFPFAVNGDEVVAVSGGHVWPCFPTAWEGPKNFHELDEIRLTSRGIVRSACLGRLADAVSRSGRIYRFLWSVLTVSLLLFGLVLTAC
jgi:hypothetical protein